MLFWIYRILFSNCHHSLIKFTYFYAVKYMQNIYWYKYGTGMT